MWYHLFDNYNEGEVPSNVMMDSEKYFGLVYPDYNRKSGSWAYQLCANFLPGSRYTPDFPVKENITSNIVSFCFMNGVSGNNTLIIWNDKSRTQKVRLHLPVPALLHDLSSNNSRPLLPETVLDITNQPLFITWQGPGIPRLSQP
jgi:hypothetical protein